MENLTSMLAYLYSQKEYVDLHAKDKIVSARYKSNLKKDNDEKAKTE